MNNFGEGGGDRPKVRTDGLLAERVDRDLVIYDERSQMAHSLSPDAALVWDRCDGRSSRGEIAEQLRIAPHVVDLAVDEFEASGLLTIERGYSRRDFGKRAAAVGGAALATPLLYSVAVPGAAAACSHAGCNFAIVYNDFNPVTAGNFLWFHASMQVTGNNNFSGQITLTGSTISFTDSGTAYNINVPDTIVNISPGASGSAVFSTPAGHPNGLWTVSAPSGSENIFLGGVELQAPAGGFAGHENVTWNFPLSGPTGVNFNVQWAFEAYTSFSTNYSALGVVAYDGQPGTSGHDGTPDNFQGDQVAGGSNGSESSTVPCAPKC